LRYFKKRFRCLINIYITCNNYDVKIITKLKKKQQQENANNNLKWDLEKKTLMGVLRIGISKSLTDDYPL